jgi:hypothetical protein
LEEKHDGDRTRGGREDQVSFTAIRALETSMGSPRPSIEGVFNRVLRCKRCAYAGFYMVKRNGGKRFCPYVCTHFHALKMGEAGSYPWQCGSLAYLRRERPANEFFLSHQNF